MSNARSDAPRRGLTLDEAAGFVGVTPDKFNKLMAEGRMPRPKLIDNVRRWDVVALHQYFAALPEDERTDFERSPQGRRAMRDMGHRLS